MFDARHLEALKRPHAAASQTGGHHRYRYAVGAPTVSLPLDPDAAVAHLRELVYYHRHHSALYRARARSLAAEVLDLRARIAKLEGSADA